MSEKVTSVTFRNVDVSGVRRLTLRATDGGDGRNFDHASWA
jgi:hypothetical protein